MQVAPSFPGEFGAVASQDQQQPLFPEYDNLNERKVKSVPQPAANKPTDAEFYINQAQPGGSLRPNPTFLRDHFFREGRLTEEQALFILREATALLSREPNMVEVKSPVTICGDIHGQYYDLMKLFEVGGGVSNNTYLFLGDYVDRGCFGMECLLLLYSLKLCYPNQFVLLRGNHECRHLTEYFTFKRECLRKYSPVVYEACIESFCSLPVSARVDDQFFCVHGGLSPELHTLDDLRSLNRFREPGSEGLLCDLLWADPVADYGHENEMSPAQLPPGTQFVYNHMRGCSFNFTYDAACNFLDRNGLLGIIRGHEAQDSGYQMHRKSPSHRFPSVITVFSAPNYCDAYHNRGAVLKYHNKNVTIRQFNSSPHPYWLPNFMDAFTWSLPFVGAKITEMLLAILSICSQEELEDEEGDSDDENRTVALASPAEIAARRQAIRNKILAVGKMQRVFQILREESEAQSELSDGAAKLGSDALSVQMGSSIRNFQDARQSDMLNERLPNFKPAEDHGLFPAPSMRVAGGQAHGTQGDAGINMDYLIRRTLEDGYDDGGVVEALADKIARGRTVTGRPAALKRFDTT